MYEFCGRKIAQFGGTDLEQEHSNTEFDGQFWGKVTVYTEVERQCFEESVELKTLLTEKTTFCNTSAARL